MEPGATLTSHIEALLFASTGPLRPEEISGLLENALEQAFSTNEIMEYILRIKAKYEHASFPFELKESGGGYQFLTKKEFHQTVLQLNGDKYIKKLSSASLETLSIIAYKQPVTKIDIETIRGVSSDYSVQKLLEKELIYISGRKEDAIGKPLLYCTTRHFMDYLGINGPEGLPQLKEIISMEAALPNFGAEAVVNG